MHPACRRAVALPLLGAAAACMAQTTPPVAVAAPAAAAASATLAASRPDKRVIEDDKVRIEETRVRGQTQRITVHSKVAGVRDYEIILPPAGKDPSQDRGAAGKRTWSVLDF
jgi:uncharacterized membrane protein